MSDPEDQQQLDEAAAPQPEMALLLRSSKHQKQVGVAVRRPRLRQSCVKGREGEDTKQWALTLLEFSDSSELANLETLLVQLAPSKCYVSAELEQTQQVGASPRFRTYRLTRQTDPLASAKC
jgi:DNA mismatch repair protein MSH2